MKRKIGLLGGTFDPVHYGHIRLAEECMKKLELEEIWFIPSAIPPHKDWKISPYEKRAKWLEQAIGSVEHYRILDIETRREGKSYTYHTLKELMKTDPDCEFYFLTGADSLEKLDTWYRWEDILDMCHFVATNRPGYERSVPENLAKEAEKRKGGIICLEINALDISSTEVREQIAMQKDLEKLIPSEIIDEVKESMEIKEEGYKTMLRKRLSPKRYMHSVGVANTAAKLAGMYDGDVRKAYLAGLLHDFAREVPDNELLEIALEHDLTIDEAELMQPNLLHGPVGAWLLKEQGIITDDEILEAIRWHTTGNPDMGQLARIVCLADYIEPNRVYPGVELLRQIAYRNLNAGLLASLDQTILHLMHESSLIHPYSIATRNRIMAEQINRKQQS